MVLDKPSGLLTIPTPRKEKRTLTSILNEEFAAGTDSARLHPCHRLDRETSGLIIYAKGKSLQQKMMDEFKARQVKKTYTAFARGCPHKKEGRINFPIEGESALTEYKVIEQRKGFSVIEVRPLTGRTNQIRIHLSRLGNPVLGETKYAFRRDFDIKAKRLCLHAKELEFKHPVTGKPVCLRVDLPEELKIFLKTHL